MEFYSISDIGLQRENNQDNYISLANQHNDFLFLVCDGIGGGKAGDVASRVACEYFNKVFPSSGPFDTLEDASNYLNSHINKANEVILELSRNNLKYSGMGTTLTGLFVSKLGTLSVNLGDSRVYGFIDHKLVHLTKDHTLMNQMIDNGEITYEESLNHPKNIIL